jgi:prevent-host-death family protein
VKQVAISKFKAKCLSMLDEVRKTRQPLVITRRGIPVAEVVPPTAKREGDWLGLMKGRMEIIGDIVSPASDPDDWEVLGD